jgi:hypothetical protein
MRRSRRLAIAALAVAGLAMPAAAHAGGVAKFHSASASVANNGALLAAFDERGLVSDDIDYELEAHMDAEWGCVNGGSKHPQAADKETISAQVSATASYEPKNGRVVATIETAAPTAGDFECPAGQKLVFGSVSYSDIELYDLTNGTGGNLPDVPRVFATF